MLGSYLDPLGDKVLVGSVMCALAYKGLIPGWVAAVVVGRDVALVGGMFVHRFRMLNWQWPGAAVFFKTAALPAAAPPPAATAHNSPGHPSAAPPGQQQEHASTSSGGAARGAEGSSGGVPIMKPLMISKVNTVLQLSLVGGCMTQAFYGWPGVVVMQPLEIATAATTVLSSAAYVYKYATGKLLPSGDGKASA